MGSNGGRQEGRKGHPGGALWTLHASSQMDVGSHGQPRPDQGPPGGSHEGDARAAKIAVTNSRPGITSSSESRGTVAYERRVTTLDETVRRGRRVTALPANSTTASGWERTCFMLAACRSPNLCGYLPAGASATAARSTGRSRQPTRIKPSWRSPCGCRRRAGGGRPLHRAQQ